MFSTSNSSGAVPRVELYRGGEGGRAGAGGGQGEEPSLSGSHLSPLKNSFASSNNSGLDFSDATGEDGQNGGSVRSLSSVLKRLKAIAAKGNDKVASACPFN